jgi:hypothetical protein
MFGPRHYVPILRWKQGERLALRALRRGDRDWLTPLIEIPRKMFEAPKKQEDQGADAPEAEPEKERVLFPEAEGQTPDPGQVLLGAAKGILGAWHYQRFFLDLCHVDGQVPQIQTQHPLAFMAAEARRIKLFLVPVTGLSRRDEYQMAVAQIAATDGRGICVRVTHDEVLRSTFSAELGDRLTKLFLKAADVDLLVDFQDFDPEKPSIREVLDRVPVLNAWRSLTVASGAFPKDLQQCKDPGRHAIPRNDWLAWRRLSKERLKRQPSFSDYTVQWGRYEEPKDRCNPSASIRYTLSEEWLVMRGEGIFNKDGPGPKQWPANAILLRESEDFYSSGFSAGDEYISRMGDGADGNGNPGTWISAGINHHMTVVSRQIATLPDSLSIDALPRAGIRSPQQRPVRHRSIRGT